ncbi:ATP-dependent RNA helicase HrpA [Candidatus Endobugula sertula]|uniref:ATP-dependent RNA helicase HrpA n=1 Tax=Candidatus Endobugula sertula TaxID=62101 RepID=A0A1D2QN55_9GAMM|nr:ATP-dependent RNA helicase HrpA [Candidatus Endobugula sertula]
MSSPLPSLALVDNVALLEQVSTRDRFRLSQQLVSLQKQYRQLPTSDGDKRWLALLARIESSIEWVQARRDSLPAIEFPEQLPIYERREEIAKAISENQVIILAGETGSGKTTQLPKICLSIGRGVKGMIGHTQPRRIAARTVAMRIAEELHTPLGSVVGYQVRFTDQVSDNTAVKLMTDGILLTEIQQDRFLSRYDTIIIDEAHERSLNIDFLLGYLKQLLPKRPDLKVIVTSATIDVEKFSQHFDDAPVIEVSGRTFPVEVLYRPPLDNDDEQNDIYSSILAAIDEIEAIDKVNGRHQGDILVFLSGEKEIREVAQYVRQAQVPHLNILPLYARLSVSEQNKIFQAHRGRRVVLSTNVAETALTVPGIRYVIDTGLARVSRYSFRTKVQRLPIEPISQASANQRKGRCGRTSEGVCIRLYSEEDFHQRPEFTDAEILRTNLAAVILQMAQLKLGDVRRFPFVDVPDHRLINDGYKLLQELQVMNDKGHLLPQGRQLAALPVDPRLGRMLIAANVRGCVNEVAIIISALSIQDPRERPANKQQAADQIHRQWWDEDSDFVGYLNLWCYYEEQRQVLSSNQLQKWCKKHYIAYMRMREWRDTHMQICIAAKRIGIKPVAVAASYEAVHQALLSGLLGYIGHLSEEKGVVGEYMGTRNRRFSIFPGSSQFKKKPKWVVAGQLLETSKLYAHHLAKIEPKWILDNAQHLVKRHYSEPHYAIKSGQVMAFEKITLYGVVLVEKQRVVYSKIDPTLSRELFIRSALVEGAYGEHTKVKQRLAKTTPEKDFFSYQLSLLNELSDLEAKSRRCDIVVDEQVLFDFYDARLPKDIMNLQGFEHWRQQIEKQQPKLLFVDRNQLMQHTANHVTEAQFPDHLTLNGLTLPLSYHFEPNHKDDGVSLHIPVSALHLIKEEPLEWLVPGLLREKCIAMVKALPKQWRKHFVPVPAYIDRALQSLDSSTQHENSLALVLAEQLFRQTGVKIPNHLWSAITLDSYYQMNLCIMDEQQQRIDSSRELSLLRERYRDHVQERLQVSGHEFERKGMVAWDFGQLPKDYELQQQGVSICAYPALVDQGDSVDLTLYDNPRNAEVDSLRGMVRLALLEQRDTVKYLHKHLFKGKELGLSVVDIGSRQQVVDDVVCAAIRQVCFHQPPLIRSKEDFAVAIEQGRSHIVEKAEWLVKYLLEALSQVVIIKKQIKQANNPLIIAYAAGDIQQQLQNLFYSGMMYDTPGQWLQQYPRYMKAIQLRLEKVSSQVNKDRAIIADIEPLWQRLQDKRQKEGEAGYWLNEELQQHRWMIEELRVSLFAQTVKTIIPISVKRLNKHWELC